MRVQGILAVAWNAQDPAQLLTTGYDCRTLLWDVPEGEVRGELPLHAGPGRDVRWSPRQPNLIATAAEAWDASGGSQQGQVGPAPLSMHPCKLPLHAGPGRDVRWSPGQPGLIATAAEAWDASGGSQQGQVEACTFEPAPCMG